MSSTIQHNLDHQVIERYVESFCAYLGESANTKPIKLNRAWVGTIPNRPGVYSIFAKNSVVYAGESGNLQARMSDLLDSRHHVLRRNLGLELFGKDAGFEPATTHKRFPPEFEERLNKYIQMKLKICLASAALGRKEIEESLIDRYKPIYNRKGRRN